MAVESMRAEPSFRDLLRAFSYIGFLSFGGAAGQIAMMHRIVVEERRWLTERQYLNALNYCMLLPGPEAQQLATYIGWLTHGVWGGLAAGLLFVIPGALIMLGLSFFFVWGQGIPAVDGLFLGIKAAVVAIVVHAMIRIGSRTLVTRALVLLALAAFVAIEFFRVPFPLVILFAALAGAMLAPDRATSADSGIPAGQSKAAPAFAAAGWSLIAWWTPVTLAALALGRDHRLVEIGLYFSKLAVITFGGAYAVLAYLSQSAVEIGWVTTPEMAAGLGLAETTPGPTILVNQFVAFLAGMRDAGGLSPLAAAVLAALMASWVTFAPSFVWIFAGAPFAERLHLVPWIQGALKGIGAAVAGVIGSVAITFAFSVLFGTSGRSSWWALSWPAVNPGAFDPVAMACAVAAAVTLFVFHRGVLTAVLVAGALGVLFVQ